MAKHNAAFLDGELDRLAEIAWTEWRNQYDYDYTDLPWDQLADSIKERWRHIAHKVVDKFVGG